MGRFIWVWMNISMEFREKKLTAEQEVRIQIDTSEEYKNGTFKSCDRAIRGFEEAKEELKNCEVRTIRAGERKVERKLS